MAKAQVNWKKIQIDDDVFKNYSAEGLIGIEECTDYNIDDFITSEIQSCKRKAEIESTEPSRKKQKTKKSKAKKKFSLLLESKDESEDVEIAQENSGFSLLLEPGKEPDLGTVVAWTNYSLPEPLLKALSVKGFTEPTLIQQRTLAPAILGRRDILGAAETGSGKTLAFGLPILTAIIKEKNELKKVSNEGGALDNQEKGSRKIKKPLYALILTPTRELAIQVKSHLDDMVKFTDIKVAVLVGGLADVKQERILKYGPEIVVATPGRLWELVQQRNPHLAQISSLKFLVIDEADRMLEKGHFEELHNLLEMLNIDETAKKLRQNFVFSATLTLTHELPNYIKRKVKKKRLREMNAEQKLYKIIETLGITNPKTVDVTEGSGTSKTLTECRITCSLQEKDYYVYYFLQKHSGRTLIFCNSIGCVKRLAHLLKLLNCNSLPLHALMKQKQRLKNLERFRGDDNGILVATDVAARGLDIPKIEHVLHYQTPRTAESYVHRSGRTARASKEGITVLLMEPSEFMSYIKLCKTLNKSEDLPVFPIQTNFFTAVKQRVNLAREVDQLQLQVQKSNDGWIQKMAEEAGLVMDDSSKEYNDEETSNSKKVAHVKQKQLEALLAKPVFPKNFSGKYPLGLDFPLQQTNEEKAVDVMKAALQNSKSKKIKTIPLYKRKKV